MTIEELFKKALYDPTFFDELGKDPEKAFDRIGVAVNKVQIEKLKNLDYKVLKEVAQAFSPDRFIT